MKRVQTAHKTRHKANRPRVCQTSCSQALKSIVYCLQITSISSKINILTVSSIWPKYYDGLVQVRHNSSALAMELCLSCTNPSTCSDKKTWNQEHKIIFHSHDADLSRRKIAALLQGDILQPAWEPHQRTLKESILSSMAVSTAGCHYDNLWCHQRQKSWHRDNSQFPVKDTKAKTNLLLFNSLWPSDAIWWLKSRSKLSQVMAWCSKPLPEPMLPTH